jgi:uncharacterized protein HemX
MPEKTILENPHSVSSITGIISLGISSVGALALVIFKWVMKKKDDQEKENKDLKKENETQHRAEFEKSLQAQWIKVDAYVEKMIVLSGKIERLEGRFEDLQRAFEKLQQSHFEQCCKNMANQILEMLKKG